MLPTSGSNLLKSDRQHWQPQSCLASLLHTDLLFFFTLFHAPLLALWASRQKWLTTVSRHTAALSVSVRLTPTWISCQFLHNVSPFFLYLFSFVYFCLRPFFGPLTKRILGDWKWNVRDSQLSVFTCYWVYKEIISLSLAWNVWGFFFLFWCQCRRLSIKTKGMVYFYFTPVTTPYEWDATTRAGYVISRLCF